MPTSNLLVESTFPKFTVMLANVTGTGRYTPHTLTWLALTVVFARALPNIHLVTGVTPSVDARVPAPVSVAPVSTCLSAIGLPPEPSPWMVTPSVETVPLPPPPEPPSKRAMGLLSCRLGRFPKYGRWYRRRWRWQTAENSTLACPHTR